MDNVEIERGNRSTVQDGTHAADDNEIDLVLGEGPQDRQKVRS